MSTNISEPATRLQIVNADPRYPKAHLIEPTTLGYLHISAAVRPSPIPLVLPSAERSNLLKRVKQFAYELQQLDEVVNVTVFRAIMMPPTTRFSRFLKEQGAAVHVANFDVVVLVQTTSPATARQVQNTPVYAALIHALRTDAKSVRSIVARNAKRIADVDTRRRGLFLFNHFVAADATVMLQLWDYLAGWYMVETGLDNSVVLVPLDGEASDYPIINWARWDDIPLRHFWRQLSTRSFWNYVTANLEVNRAASMPIYYRLA